MIMVKKFRVKEKKSINNCNETTNNIIILIITAFSVASIDTVSGTTIAYIGDAEEFGESGIPELTKDFNQILIQSPSGKVDAVIMLGDMDLVAQVLPAYSNSTAKDIPAFYVVGNHESANLSDLNMIRTTFAESLILLNSGPDGTNQTTYSLDIGELHIINMNEYWDGNYDGVCEWNIPAGGVSADDACFKYSDSDGGYVPDALYNWINADLTETSQPWKIVVGHEPLYPSGRHVGNSLDNNDTNRDKIQNLFLEQKVAVFLSGHTHTSEVQLIEGVYHVAAGVTGSATIKGDDSFASLFYTHTNPKGDLILTWKRENLTWDTPISTSYMIGEAILPSTIPPQSRNLQNNIGNYWVNHTWQAGTGVLTDTYNISVNGIWYNGTDQYYNDSVGASNWSNITVWAWNNSGSGNMSVLSISQNIRAPSLPLPINITSYSPISPIIDNEGATRTFNLTLDETVELTWYINETHVSSNSSVTAGNYTNTSARSGKWNVSAVANNSNGSVVKTWIWEVSDLTARAGGPYTGTPGVLINFSGSASGGTAPYSYNWSFGDGGTSLFANTSHAYSNQGSYTATLTVTDNAGRTSLPDTAPVSVEWVRFINGTVMDSINKAGLEGVKVFTNTSLSTVTNATGFYSFSINSGIYNIAATLEPSYYQNSTTVSLLGAVVVQDIELSKKPNGSITGRISNA